MSSLHVPIRQVFVVRWVGLNRLSAIVVVLLVLSFLFVALLVSLVVEVFALFRTGSGVRTPVVAFVVGSRRIVLSRPLLPLRTVATVSDSSRTVVTIFVSCRLAFVPSCCSWLRAERHLRETFTSPFVPFRPSPLTTMASTFEKP